MTKRRNYIIFILFISFIFALPSCGSSRPPGQYNTVEEAEKARAKDRQAAAKIAKKQEKEAKKEFWKRQSKEARKRVKKTEREMKKRGKERRKR